jgi:hypothetical protein
MKKSLRAAVKLFRDFRDKEPRKLMTVDYVIPDAVMVIGHVDEICYTTTHGRKTVSYRHPFREGSRPLLAASSDGKQLLLLGGRYKFTSRGIVDRKEDGTLDFDPRHGEDEGEHGYSGGFMRKRQANPAEFKSYVVHMDVQYPAYNERNGVDFAIEAATSKADAIKQARREAEAAGYDRHSGRKVFSAREGAPA